MNRERGEHEPFVDPLDELADESGAAHELMVAGLPHELPSPGAWERLSAAVAAEPRRPAGHAETEPLSVTGAVSRGPRAPGAPRRYGRWQRRYPPALRVAARVAAACLFAAAVTLGAVYVVQARAVAAMRSEQRLLAAWMSEPGMRLIALRAPASTSAAEPPLPGGWLEDEEYGDAGLLGIVCVLPDGRALVFQPEPAPRGATYVVSGRGAAGEVELARGAGALLQFAADGVDWIGVRLVSQADQVTPVAWASLD